MVTFTVYRANSGGAYVEGVCLATDEKPVAGITNGSILFSVDTTDGTLTRYMFDQNSATWVETECPCSCDGGGSGGGSALPEVTAEDNGDVLTVVDGAWGKAAPSGGSDSNVMFVGWRVEHDPDLGTVIVVDKTAQEIMEFTDEGKAVVLVNHNLFQQDNDRSVDLCFTYSTVY